VASLVGLAYIFMNYSYIIAQGRVNIDVSISNIPPMIYVFMIFLVIFQFVFRFFWLKFYPPIQYKFGEEAIRLENLSKTRNKIFWGVFMASLVGLVISNL